MMDSAFLKKLRLSAWAADGVAALGFAAYLAQLIHFAYTTVSNLDEGAYLLKGYLFASGASQPFAPGMYTNKAPLAFLIPGYVQLWFGEGLRSGRWMAALFGALALLLVWHTARRISSAWLAAGAVWTMALSPVVIKYYSGAATQGTIAFFLSAVLALTLGAERKNWHLLLGGFLAGAMVMTRENMTPVLPLLALYVWWQYGWKKGLLFFLPGLALIAALHALYWPQILRLWYWLPLVDVAPPAQTYSGGGTRAQWQPLVVFSSRLLSVFEALRFHLIPILGALFALILFPAPRLWKSKAEFGVFAALQALFWGLLYMHYEASIGRNYCVFCFSPYLAFFNLSALILAAFSLRQWNQSPGWAAQASIALLFVIVFAGVGLSLFERIGAPLLNLPAPRVSGMKLRPGWTDWGALLLNGLELPANTARQVMSAAAGFFLGAAILLLLFLLWRRYFRSASIRFGAFAAYALLALALSSSFWLHGNASDCGEDVIAANEDVGAYLASVIPPGASVYWDGGLSAAPLLYLPGREIFPAQINSGYTFLSGADTEQAVKFGYWNEELKTQWRRTAQFFIVSNENYEAHDWNQYFDDGRFDEFPRSKVGTACSDDSRLRIFRRK